VENVNPIAALAKYSIPYRDDGGDWIKVMSVWAEDSDKTCFDVHGAIHRRDGTFKCIKTDTSMSLIVWQSAAAVSGVVDSRCISIHQRTCSSDASGR